MNPLELLCAQVRLRNLERRLRELESALRRRSVPEVTAKDLDWDDIDTEAA